MPTPAGAGHNARDPLVCGGDSRAGVLRSRDGQGDGIDVTARHLERVEWAPYPNADLDRWPFTVPVVRQLLPCDLVGKKSHPAGTVASWGEGDR